MGKNLTGKTVFIVAVLVVFLYGIFGIPHGGLKQSVLNRIHLGLDLKGGTHLVLEVHVAEAVGSETDRDVARLEADLQKAGVTGATVGKLDPTGAPAKITISGVPTNKVSDARGVFTGNDYAAYDIATNADGST